VDLLAKGVEGAVLDDADSGHALADDLGHLAILEVFDEAKEDHLPLFLAEAHDGLADALDFHLALEGLLRVAVAAAVDEGLGELCAVLARAKVADADVVRDAEEPGEERRAPDLVAVDGLPGLKKGLGGEVLGLGSVADEVVEMAVHAYDVPVIEGAEGLLVALDGALDQGTFVEFLYGDNLEHGVFAHGDGA
jgi:hypothetical protein